MSSITFLQMDFLSLDDIEVIEKDSGERMKTRNLLRMLMQRSEGAYKSFIKALTETSSTHVVAKLTTRLAAIQQESTSQQDATATRSEYQ